jgi:hypothetical protein
MTPEPTPPPSSRPRPGADARRRALGLDESAPDGGADADGPVAPASTAPASAASTPAAPARRESLRDSLARIPDLAPDESLDDAPPIGGPEAVLAAAMAAGPGAVASEPRPRAVVGGGPAAPVAPSAPASPQVAFRAPTAPPVAGPRPEPDRLAATATPPGGPGVEAPVVRTVRTKPPMWRRITFSIVLLGLVAAIPVLGYKGYQLISESKDGEYAGTTLSPTDPGYEAQVDPTPTAVAIQYDDEHRPVGLTFLSLSGGEGGGSVIFVPLDTEVSEPSYGVDRLRTAYDVVADRPTVARARLASQVGRLLNVGVNEIIDLDNAGWEQLIGPVGPLTIDNPDEIDLGFGQIIPSGTTTLTAAQTGPYLAATVEGESDLNRLARHEAV